MVNAQDERYMERALFHAARGAGRTSPNPLVGAVIVSANGVVVGQGFHQRAGEAHAEVHALAEAGARARGATLYCTLEPCCHQGRTGPCVSKIVDAGVARVVAAVEDPNPAVRGRGFAFLRDCGVAVDVGLAAEKAVALNQPFFTLMREGRPFVVLKAATSVDGRIAEAPGRRTQLTEDTTRAFFVFDRLDGLSLDELHNAADDLARLLRGRWPDCHVKRAEHPSNRNAP